MDLHVDSVCVASDCSEVVANIEAGVPCHYVTILREITAQQTLFRDLKFIHEKRQHNDKARALAKASSSLSLEIGRAHV